MELSNYLYMNDLKTLANISYTMRLSHNKKQTIIKQLPRTIELYHGKFVHNKVPYCQYFRIIPKGKKYLIWFKKYKTDVYCYLMEIKSYKKKIIDVIQVNASFNTDLTSGLYGTICYGTKMLVDGKQYFSVEDILYYKNRCVIQEKWNRKYKYMLELMKQTTKLQFTKYDMSFGVPFMDTSRQTLEKEIPFLPYPSYCIEGFNMDYGNVYKMKIEIENVIHGTFILKAAIKSDNYHIYCENNKIGNAYIPSYKLSVYMNSYFRDIKENRNLDYLEESDDESEFEDISLDKYVDMEKELPFRCVYNKRFRAWIPETYEEAPVFTKYNAIKYLSA